jgi:Bacterial HORMA domain 2
VSTVTFVISYAYTVTHVTAKILHILTNIIRDIGLDPSKLVGDWAVYEDGISTWLASHHLQRVTLEVYDPETNDLVTRWDMDVVYSSVRVTLRPSLMAKSALRPYSGTATTSGTTIVGPRPHSESQIELPPLAIGVKSGGLLRAEGRALRVLRINDDGSIHYDVK